jgi:hypothetical protein
VRRFWECIGNRDVEGYLATFAEGAIAYDPVNGPPLSSTDDRRAFIEGMLGNFPKIEARIDFLTPCGDHVAAKWTVDAVTNSGDAARIEGIDTYRHAADGRISEMWGYFQI